jgi:S-adenosylmethionine decarboxylase
MKNFAPDIHRQRLVVEGIYKRAISESTLCNFLTGLSEMLGMHILFGPLVMKLAEKRDVKYRGYEAVLVWAESGCQLYTWEDNEFFSLDVYSCKPFDNDKVVAFCREELFCEEIDCKEV